jgi:amidase
MTREITHWSAVETAEKIHNKDVSIVEVTQAHIARMDALNPTLNAITTPVVEAMDTARALDNAGIPDDCGPLYGVPVTTKINVDQAGYANSNGIPAYKDNAGTYDAPVVANLKKAGAVIIGRTNTPEFSMRWSTSNPLHGVTLNPWDATVTPGGSSGAAAAAVASGIGAIAHGNDLGGSLRYPAYCCGVTTIRPSFGRVPIGSPNQATERPPLTQTMSVQGPIARSVADVRVGLQVMSMRSSFDPLQVPAQSSGRIRSNDITVGFAINPFDGPVDTAVETAMKIALSGLKSAGIATREIIPPFADDAVELWGGLLMTEARHTLHTAIKDHGSPEMNKMLGYYFDRFPGLDVGGLFTAMSKKIKVQRAWSQMFDEIDVFMMPTALSRPLDNDLDFKSPERIPEILDSQRPLQAINLLGLPSVALPTHLEGGVPLGVQLVAPMYDDWFALDVAERLEVELGTLWQQLPLWAD